MVHRKCWSNDDFLFDFDEIEIRLPFYRSFSTIWNIFGGLYTHAFYSWVWVRGNLESSVSENQKLYHHNPNIKPEFNKEKMKAKTNCNLKVLLGLIIST